MLFLDSIAGLAMPVFFVVLFVAFAIYSGVVAQRRRAAAIAGYEALVRQHGFVLTGRYPMYSLHGTLEGLQIHLEHDVWIGHKGRRHYRHDLAVVIERQLGDLSLSREGFLDSIGRVFGGQDIQIGDSRFDGAFVVKCSNEHGARRILDGRVREALLEAQARIPNVYVGNGAVRLGGQGPANPDVIMFQLEALAVAARAFSPPSTHRQPANPFQRG